jgi:hypothetical protein
MMASSGPVEKGRLMTSGKIPDAEWAQLMALREREDQLQAMLPTGLSDFLDLDADQFNSKLADIELISAEMLKINAAEKAILEELERRSV